MSCVNLYSECVLTHALRWIVSRGDSRTSHAIPLTDSMSLLQNADWEAETGMSQWSTSTFETSSGCTSCPEYAGMKGNDRTNRMASKANLTSGSLVGRAEMLRSLRYYLQTQSQGHHSIDHLEERGVDAGSARRFSLKGRERAIVCQTNKQTISKTTLGKRLRDGVMMVMILMVAILSSRADSLRSHMILHEGLFFFFFFFFFFVSAFLNIHRSGVLTALARLV